MNIHYSETLRLFGLLHPKDKDTDHPRSLESHAVEQSIIDNFSCYSDKLFSFFGALLVVVALLLGKKIIYPEGQYGTDRKVGILMCI